jgi:hypothetical protein
MAVILCHTIAFTIGVAMQCLPLDNLWDPKIPAKCIDLHVFAICGASLSIFYDIIIMLLPISELKSLNLTLRKRLALCFMFALGSLYIPPLSILLSDKNAHITQCVRNQYGPSETPQGFLPYH